MVIVRTDFQKCNLMALLDFGANFFQLGIHGCREHRSPVFRRAHDVVHQNRNIVVFVNELAHSPIVKPQQADGVLNP